MSHDNHRKKAMSDEWLFAHEDGGRVADTLRDHFYNDGNRSAGNGQRDPDLLHEPRDIDFTRPCGAPPLKRDHHDS